MTISIGILDRDSRAVDRTIRSRASQGRLIDAGEFLAQTGRADLKLYRPDELLAARSATTDVVLVSCPNKPQELDALAHARKLGIRVIVDITDDLTITPRWTQLGFDQDLLKSVIGLADGLSVTNQYLADRFASTKSNVFIVRSGFYVEKYDLPRPAPTADRFLVTMCNGDRLKSDDFSEAFVKLIYDFVSDHADVVFDFFGDEPFPAPAHDRIRCSLRRSFEEHKQALVSEPYELTVMMLGNRDLGHDAEFFLGKSAVKYWEHGGLGIPGLFSESAIYRACIVEGRNGMMAANTEAAWLEKLNFAYHNRGVLRQMGEIARRDVIDNYHIRVTADDIVSAVEAVLA